MFVQESLGTGYSVYLSIVRKTKEIRLFARLPVSYEAMKRIHFQMTLSKEVLAARRFLRNTSARRLQTVG